MKRFTRKVVEHNNLRLIEARVPVMGSAESGGTINHRLIVDSLFGISLQKYYCVTQSVEPFKMLNVMRALYQKNKLFE